MSIDSQDGHLISLQESGQRPVIATQAARRCRSLPSRQIRADLRTSLHHLAAGIDSMTRVDFARWLDDLPDSEFLEFVDLGHEGVEDLMKQAGSPALPLLASGGSGTVQ